MHLGQTWQTYRWPERRLFLTSLLLLPITAGALKVASFKRVIAWLPRLLPMTERMSDMDAQTIARLVDGAARRQPWHIGCLPRSLILWALLRTQGIKSELRIGVHSAETLSAHAWVEVDGKSVGESADVGQRFVPFNASFASEKDGLL